MAGLVTATVSVTAVLLFWIEAVLSTAILSSAKFDLLVVRHLAASRVLQSVAML